MNNYKPNYKQIVSTQIVGADYNEETHEMFLKFKNGAEYKYSEVTQAEFDNFMASESKGKFLNAYLRCKPYEKL